MKQPIPLSTFTVVGLFDEASSRFLVAGVLEGEHDCVDHEDYLSTLGMTRGAYVFQARSAEHAMDLACAGFQAP
jgi:hypothetical protein